MQGFLFIALAAFAGVLKGYFGKSTSNFTATPAAAVRFSTMRMGFAVVVGAVFVAMEGNFSSLYLDWPTLLFGIASGAANSALIVSWLFCVRSGAFMMVNAVQTVSVVVLPTVVSGIFLGELPRWNDYLGIVLLLGATVLMFAYSGKIKGKLSPSSIALLLLCSLSAGCVNVFQKLFMHSCEGQRASVYNLVSYVASAAILLLLFVTVFLPRSKKEAEGKSEAKLGGKMLFFAFMMAACMFVNTFFSTLAAGLLPAAQTFPVLQGLVTVGDITMSALAYRERPTLTCLIGVFMNLSALMIINLL